MDKSLNLNSLRHAPPACLADLEDDLEKQAEMAYNAAKLGASNDHHQLHKPQVSHRRLVAARRSDGGDTVVYCAGRDADAARDPAPQDDAARRG